METYWISLGKEVGGGTYVRETLSHHYWAERSRLDDFCVVLIRIDIDPELGSIQTSYEKNKLKRNLTKGE